MALGAISHRVSGKIFIPVKLMSPSSCTYSSSSASSVVCTGIVVTVHEASIVSGLTPAVVPALESVDTTVMHSTVVSIAVAPSVIIATRWRLRKCDSMYVQAFGYRGAGGRSRCNRCSSRDRQSCTKREHKGTKEQRPKNGNT